MIRSSNWIVEKPMMNEIKKAPGLLAGLVAILFFSCFKPEKAFQPADNSVYDLAYAQGIPGEEFLKLDAHFPNQAKNLPVIVYIHGGGWTESDKKDMDVWCQRMSRRGYVVFNVNYRLAPEFPFPAAVNDCLGAMAWIQEHAKNFGGDPSRIGITGGSAGGHLIAMVASAWKDKYFQPTGSEGKDFSLSIQAQAPFFGVFDFHHLGAMALTNIPKKFLGGSEKQVPENYCRASPVSYVSKDTPPTLIVVGRLDPIYHQSKIYYDALKKAGVPVEMIVYPAQTHGFDIQFKRKASIDAFEKMMSFFDRYLK